MVSATESAGREARKDAPSTVASVITAKPAICDHFKTGQRSRGQDMKLFYRAGAGSGKFCFGLP
jgi:hypothetical protein